MIATTQQTQKSKGYFNKRSEKKAPAEPHQNENFDLCENDENSLEVERSFVLKSTKKTFSNNH